MASLARRAVACALVFAVSTASAQDIGTRDCTDTFWFMARNDLTAQVRITGFETVRAIEPGYRLFAVEAAVVEAFKGQPPVASMQFHVMLELPSEPPSQGEFVVNLKRSDEGLYAFDGNGQAWVQATPMLIAALRSGDVVQCGS